MSIKTLEDGLFVEPVAPFAGLFGLAGLFATINALGAARTTLFTRRTSLFTDRIGLFAAQITLFVN